MKLQSLSSLKKKELETIIISELPTEIKMTTYAKEKAYTVNKLIREICGSSLEWYGFTLADKSDPEIIIDIGLGKNAANQAGYTKIEPRDIDDFLRAKPENTIINGWIHSHGNLGFHQFSGTDDRNHKTVLDFVAGSTSKVIGYSEIPIQRLVITSAEDMSPEKMKDCTIAIVTEIAVESAKLMEKIEGSFSYGVVVDDSGWHEQEIHFVKTKPLSKTSETDRINAEIADIIVEKTITAEDLIALKKELEKKINRPWYFLEKEKKAKEQEKKGMKDAKTKSPGEEMYEHFKTMRTCGYHLYVNGIFERNKPADTQILEKGTKTTLFGLIRDGLKILVEEFIKAIRYDPFSETCENETYENKKTKLLDAPLDKGYVERVLEQQEVYKHRAEIDRRIQRKYGVERTKDNENVGENIQIVQNSCKGPYGMMQGEEYVTLNDENMDELPAQKDRYGPSTQKDKYKLSAQKHSDTKEKKNLDITAEPQGVEQMVADSKWKPYQDYTIKNNGESVQPANKEQYAAEKTKTQQRKEVREYARNLVGEKIHGPDGQLESENDEIAQETDKTTDHIQMYDPTKNHIQ